MGKTQRGKVRLAEILAAEGLALAPLEMQGYADGDIPKAIRDHRASALEGTKMVSDNVSEYYFSLPDQRMERLGDLPSIAPPWERYWVETRRPPNMRQSPGEQQLGQWGASAFAEDYGDDHEWAMRDFRAIIRAGSHHDEATLDEPQNRPTAPMRWLSSYALWIPYYGPGGGAFPMAVFYVCLDPEGKALVTRDGLALCMMRPLVTPVTDGPVTDEVWDKFSEEMFHMLQPLLLAVAFTHFKNIVVADLWRSPKERKAVRRETGEGPIYYRTVVIDPDMGVREAGKPARSPMPARAMHMVRGHFVTYTPERPLGRNRVTGTFWRSAHLRGDRGRGLVVKDYDVRAPKGGKG